jgi:hypothetical protein
VSIIEISKVAYNAGFRGANLITAIAIALAESSGNANAVGDASLVNNTWNESIGLWQIRSLKNPSAYSYPDTLRDKQKLFDPQYNANAAYAISKQGNDFSKWTTFTNNAYTRFIADITDTIKEAGEAIEENKGTIAAGTGGIIAAAALIYFLTRK